MMDSFDNVGAKNLLQGQARCAAEDFLASMDRFARESNSGYSIGVESFVARFAEFVRANQTRSVKRRPVSLDCK
jgi:hypothetical protein